MRDNGLSLILRSHEGEVLGGTASAIWTNVPTGHCRCVRHATGAPVPTGSPCCQPCPDWRPECARALLCWPCMLCCAAQARMRVRCGPTCKAWCRGLRWTTTRPVSLGGTAVAPHAAAPLLRPSNYPPAARSSAAAALALDRGRHPGWQVFAAPYCATLQVNPCPPTIFPKPPSRQALHRFLGAAVPAVWGVAAPKPGGSGRAGAASVGQAPLCAV